MIIRCNNWEEEIDLKDIEDIDINDLIVIDYNCKAFYYLKDITEFVNELYLTISKENINNKLLNKIKEIVERLNNLNHFAVEYSKCKTQEEFIDEIINKFDTYNYKSLSEFNQNTNYSIEKFKSITEEEIESIRNNKRASFKERIESDFVDITDKYTDYYCMKTIKNTLKIVSTRKDTGLISIVNKKSNKDIIIEYIEVLNKLIPMHKETMNLSGYLAFEVTTTGMYIEVCHEVNSTLKALAYLLNSTSFRNNDYYIFDEMEMDKKLGDLNKKIDWMKNIAVQQVKFDRA